MSERVECPGCVGRGAGSWCCLCGLLIPERLRRVKGDPSELPGVPLDGWPYNVTARTETGALR